MILAAAVVVLLEEVVENLVLLVHMIKHWQVLEMIVSVLIRKVEEQQEVLMLQVTKMLKLLLMIQIIKHWQVLEVIAMVQI